MPNLVSAGILDREIDLTPGVGAVSTTEAGLAGVFAWGRVDKLVLVEDENELVSRFGKPSNYNAETFFTGANFLAYSNKLFISRALDTNARSAIANTGAVANIANQLVKNEDHYTTVTPDANTVFIAKYPGDLGNSLKVSVCDSPTAYSNSIDLVANSLISNTQSLFTLPVGSNSGLVTIVSTTNATVSATALTNLLARIAVGDLIEVGNSSVGKQLMKVSAKGAVVNTTNGGDFIASANLSLTSTLNLVSNVSSNTIERRWEYFNAVNRAPRTSQHLSALSLTTLDELHVVVIDEDGKFSGAPGTVLEVFEGLSRATDSKTEAGGTNYYKTVLNNRSAYLWAGTAQSNAVANVAVSVANSSNILPQTYSFNGGVDTSAEDTVALSALTAAWDLFINLEEVDVSIILAGKARGSATSGSSNTNNSWSVLANYLVNNIAEVRRDCVVYVSPAYNDVVNTLSPDTNNVAFRNNCVSSSYVFFDSGYKYQLDKYNDVFRYIPLNGDVAGCDARTNQVADPWYSPAGLNRGQIKNIVKLAYNPGQADRDLLYKSDINPVVNFPGQGTILYGDKTGLGRVSAFDRINVRKLFIILRKAISRAARSLLFEFNDEFTRAQFRALVEPYLRDVKGRRGIYDFKVICDTTNNTGEVIDRNEFIGDILIKPARSINFMNLNFVAVRTSVEFSETVLAF